MNIRSDFDDLNNCDGDMQINSNTTVYGNGKCNVIMI